MTPVSAPISRTSPTDSGEILQQLVQALMLLGCAPPASTPPAPPSTPATCIRSPDTFDRSNPDDLQPFLLQCQLMFNSYPQHYASDSSKVFFAISYLKKSTLEWFEIGVMESDPRLARPGVPVGLNSSLRFIHTSDPQIQLEQWKSNSVTYPCSLTLVSQST